MVGNRPVGVWGGREGGREGGRISFALVLVHDCDFGAKAVLQARLVGPFKVLCVVRKRPV